MCWLSGKGIDYILSPKRGTFCLINPDVSCTVTAKGQDNWTGSFISPDIERVERSNELGGVKPVVVHLKSGETLIYDGKNYYERIESGKETV